MPPLGASADEEAQEEARMEELRGASEQNARSRRGGREASRSPRLDAEEDEAESPPAEAAEATARRQAAGASPVAVPATATPP